MLGPLLQTIGKRRIVLASASPRRVDALRHLGLQPEVIPSKFAEDLDKAAFATARDYVMENARQKALDVFNKRLGTEGADLVIGADTVVVSPEGRIIEKPVDEADAVRILTSLSGRTHTVVTGLTLIERDGTAHTTAETTEVVFAPLEQDAIAAYVATKSPMDKAGAYGIQDGQGGSFVEGIKGCYWNVTGFPVHRFCVEVLPIARAWKQADDAAAAAGAHA